MITFKINLLQYTAAIQKVKTKNGLVDAVVIPIEANSLIKGDKGVYCDFVAFEIKQKKEGSNDTHLVKQTFPKDVYQSMSEEDKKAQPIFGNLRVWDQSPEHTATSSTQVFGENDDLPF